MTPTTDDQLLWSVAATQHRLGDLSRSQVDELIATGALEAVKIGRRKFIVAASGHAYIDSLRTGDTL